MRSRPSVFVSSTSDLADERRMLAVGLHEGFDVYLFENDRARGRSPEQRCREMIESSHVFVCLLGSRFGSVYSSEKDVQQSIVEWELEVARGCRHVEIMAFEKHPLDEVEAHQLDFLNRLRGFRGGAWLKRFDGPENVVSVVLGSLNVWLREFFIRTRTEQARVRSDQSRIMRGVAIGAVVLLALLVVSPLRGQFTSLALGLTSILTLTIVALAFLVEWRGQYE